MNRNIKQLIALQKRLEQNIDEGIDLFLKDRPFLMAVNLDKNPVINEDHTDEEIMDFIENEFEREKLIKKIEEICKYEKF